MDLGTLLNIHGRLMWRETDPGQKATGLTFNSKKVEQGFVFVAIRGTQSDGHRYLAEAVNQGAEVLVVEDISQVPGFFKGAILEVLDSKLALKALSNILYASPADHMKSVAVTGTNGKSSFCYILEHLLNSVDFKTGVIGTIDHHIGNYSWPSELTTPDPVTLYKRLADFVRKGADSYVIEVSSHALKQKRFDQGVDIAVFTNLSRDHLDYHKTVEDYFASKAMLFKKEFMHEKGEGFAVLNGDDPFGQQLAIVESDRENFFFGKEKGHDFSFTITKESLQGTQFRLVFPDKKVVPVTSPLVAEYNVYNVVAAISCVYLLGLNYQKACKEFAKFEGVPGRMQRVPHENIYAFVDYAHTDEGLRQVLNYIQKMKKANGQKHNVITVFGCGGDRDRGKRKFMGSVAFKLSDKVIVTSDNPRTEDPVQIINDAIEDLPQNDPDLFIEADREKAIQLAVNMAEKNDVILVAGKGHEDYQILGDRKFPFDDTAVLKSALKEKK